MKPIDIDAAMTDWELVESIGGSFWLGRVIADGADSVTVCPYYEIMPRTPVIASVPGHQPKPVPVVIAGIFMFFDHKNGGEGKKRVRWASREKCADMDVELRDLLHSAVDRVVAATNSSTSRAHRAFDIR